MVQQSRFITSETEVSVGAVNRIEPAYICPPFSFAGELEIGVSGYWYPTTTVRITKALVSASGPGTVPASIYILKKEPQIVEPLVLAGRGLGSTATKTTITIPETILTPYDALFIASFVESRHTGITIQILGSRVT